MARAETLQLCHLTRMGDPGGGLDSKSQTCQIQIRVQLQEHFTYITHIQIQLQVRGSVGNTEWEMLGRVRL